MGISRLKYSLSAGIFHIQEHEWPTIHTGILYFRAIGHLNNKLKYSTFTETMYKHAKFLGISRLGLEVGQPKV